METYIGAVSVNLYQNGSSVFTFDEPDFKIKELDGFRRQNFDVRSQEFGIIDGGSVSGSRVKTIERTVVVHCLGSVEEKNNVVRTLQDSLSLTSDVTMGLTCFGTEYKCTGRFSRFEMSEGNIYEPLEITFSVMCGDPYLTVDVIEQQWGTTFKTIGNDTKVATSPRFMTIKAADGAYMSGNISFGTLDRMGNIESSVDVAVPIGAAGANIKELVFMWTYNPLLRRDIDVPSGSALIGSAHTSFWNIAMTADWQTVKVGEGGLRITAGVTNIGSVTFSYPKKVRWL